MTIAMMHRLLIATILVQIVVGQVVENVKILNSGASKLYDDCHSLFQAGHRTSGIYKLKDDFEATCEFDETRGWTDIMTRGDGSMDFVQNMHYYTWGFHDPWNKNRWIGLNKMHIFTTRLNNTILKVEFTDWVGKKVVVIYGQFKVLDSASGYKLNIADFSGPKGIFDSLSYNHNMPFATIDQPDRYGCVHEMKGGWWYDHCSYTLPTGHYYEGGYYNRTTPYYWDGIFWHKYPNPKYTGYNYSLKSFKMSVSKN